MASVNDQYLEARVMSASPVELVRMLFGAAAQAVREARRHLAGGDIRARSQEISRATAILMELQTALDTSRGGELAVRLGGLYDYMERRLLEANQQQADTPLAEVLELVSTLAQGWNAVPAETAEPQAAAAPAPEPEPQPHPAAKPAMPAYAMRGGHGGGFMAAYAGASQNWSG